MKGCFVKFIDSNPFDSIYIEGDNYDTIKEKLQSFFEKRLNEKYQEEITYFNWLTIDSDFVRDYDAELTIFSKSFDSSDTDSYNYQFNFETVNDMI